MEDADKIGPRNFGRSPLLGPVDVDEIMSAAGLVLPETVDRGSFEVALNNIVKRTLAGFLTHRLQRKDVEGLRAAIRDVIDKTRGLVHSDFPPPQLPPDWIGRAETWLEEASTKIESRAVQGAPKNVEVAIFYPQVLGLLHAAFGMVPDASQSSKIGMETGAAFRFIKKATELLKKNIEARGQVGDVPEDLWRRARWDKASDAAIGKRLQKALGQQIGIATLTADGHADCKPDLPDSRKNGKDVLAWQAHSEIFAGQLNRSRHGHEISCLD